MKNIQKDFGEQGDQIFGALGEGLHHKMIGISINDERGNSVRLSVDQPVSICPFHHSLPVLKSLENALLPVIRINDLFAPGDESEGNFGLITVKTLRQEFSILRFQGYDAPGGGIVDSFQVISEDPGVSLSKPGEPFGRENEAAHPFPFSEPTEDIFWGLIKNVFFYILS